MLTAADLVATFTPDFVVYDGITALCGDLESAGVLSNFLWWTQVVDRNMPEREGWFYKTFREISEKLCLTRRKFERVRRTLVEKLGVLEYKRAGVFGKMYFRVRIDKLNEALYHLRHQKPVLPESNFQRDRDGFLLPKFIPLTLWHDFLDMRTATTQRLKHHKNLKVKWVRQLEKLFKECAAPLPL